MTNVGSIEAKITLEHKSFDDSIKKVNTSMDKCKTSIQNSAKTINSSLNNAFKIPLDNNFARSLAESQSLINNVKTSIGNLTEKASIAKSNVISWSTTHIPGVKTAIGGVQTALNALMAHPILTTIASVTAVIITLQNALGGLKDAIDSVQESRKKLVTAGAFGDDLKGIEDSIHNIIASTGKSREDLSTAIGALLSYTTESGETLENMASTFSDLHTLTGESINGMVNSSMQAFAAWKTETADMTKYLNHFYQVAQASGLSMQSIFDAAISLSSGMQPIGATLDGTITLLGKLNQMGVDSSTVISGLKTSLAKMSADGKVSMERFNKVINQIKKASDKDAIALAGDYFGGRASLNMVRAIKAGAFTGSDGKNILTSTNTTGDNWINTTKEAYLTAGDKLNATMNKLRESFHPIVEAIEKMISPKLDTLSSWIGDKLIPFVESNVLPLVEGALEFMDSIFKAIPFNAIINAYKNIYNVILVFIGRIRWDDILTAIQMVGAAIEWVLERIPWDGIIAVINILFDYIDQIIDIIPWETLVNIITAVANGIAFILEKIPWEGIYNAISSLVNTISGIFGGANDFLNGIINTLYGGQTHESILTSSAITNAGISTNNTSNSTYNINISSSGNAYEDMARAKDYANASSMGNANI